MTFLYNLGICPPLVLLFIVFKPPMSMYIKMPVPRAAAMLAYRLGKGCYCTYSIRLSNNKKLLRHVPIVAYSVIVCHCVWHARHQFIQMCAILELGIPGNPCLDTIDRWCIYGAPHSYHHRVWYVGLRIGQGTSGAGIDE